MKKERRVHKAYIICICKICSNKKVVLFFQGFLLLRSDNQKTHSKDYPFDKLAAGRGKGPLHCVTSLSARFAKVHPDPEINGVSWFP